MHSRTLLSEFWPMVTCAPRGAITKRAYHLAVGLYGGCSFEHREIPVTQNVNKETREIPFRKVQRITLEERRA